MDCKATYPLAQIAVILVSLGGLLDMREKDTPVREAMLTHATPILVRVTKPHTVAVLCGTGETASLLRKTSGGWFSLAGAYDQGLG